MNLLLHCICVNLVNIMQLTADLQSPLSEHWTHSVFCLPGGFLTGFIKDLSVFQAGVSAGKRIRWPNHINLLLSMVILHGFISVCAYRSLLEIVLGHLTLMILLSSFLWNTSMLFSRVCANVHSPKLYMKILWMYVANTLILTFLLACLLLKIDSQVLYESIVKPFRFLVSYSV